MQFLNFFQQADSNGLILKALIQIKTIAIVPKDMYWKLIFNILKNCVNCPLASDKIDIKKETCLNRNQ